MNERELKFSEIEFDDDELISGRMYHFRDPVVERVVGQFISRSNEGYKKYGQTLDSERRNGVKDLGDYLQDIQEELMDAVLYIQAAREEFHEAKETLFAGNARKTTLGDLEALDKLKRKMDAKKQKYPPPTKSCYYGGDYTSNQT
mgnify:CR=1 FL=1|jgi:hypothetical protein|tara:strand:- start:1120 stop:1554 length:435 start_codon:yes stop_codon:yes gene_type:complete